VQTMLTRLIVFLCCAWALPSVAQVPALRTAMAEFDLAYIPALAITNRQPAPPADLVQRAMARMNERWSAFRKNWANPAGARPDWKPGLDKIDGLIAAANKVVAGGKGFVAAHEELEGVRLTFLALRESAGIDYYLDRLTRFHDVMEEIHGVAKDKTAATLTDKDVAVIRKHFPDAQKRWGAVTASRPDAELGLTAEGEARHAKLVAGETQAMNALAQALAGTDRAALAKAAQSIRGPFAALYISFGDFAPLEMKP